MEAARLFDARLRQMGRRRRAAGESAGFGRAQRAGYARRDLLAAQSRRGARRRGRKRRATATSVAGRGAPHSAFMQAPAQMTVEDAIKPVHFDPEPIFIGPKPGWTGPVLAAKPTGDDAGAGSPDTARAYVNDKPPLVEGAEAQSAPAALKGALKPVKLTPLAARPHKPVAAKPLKQTVAAKAKKPAADAPLPPAH